jgi:ribosomal protein S27AE
MATAMICPRCGSKMNFHAEKITSSSPEDAGYDPVLGGAVEELHACPSCGAGASRPAVA